MTSDERSVIIGSLLGDAYLYPNGTLQIEHSFDHRAYTFWKYEMLSSIAGKPPVIVERYDRRTGKTYRSVRFYTKAVLKHLRSIFYDGRRKIVPIDIQQWLDPLAIAVWFMDDGGRGARTPKGLVFNTSCFSSEEQDLLRSVLSDKFGVSTSIHRVGKGYQIYIKADSFDRFRDLIASFLIPEMQYKLPADPVTTSSR